MSMRTPLGKVRGLGSAKSGTEHFWMQRMTAIANIPLAMFLVLLLVVLNGRDWASVVSAFHHPLIAVPAILALFSILSHMRLGLQVVIEDYTHGEFMKPLLLMANTFFVFLMGALALYSILKMSFA